MNEINKLNLSQEDIEFLECHGISVNTQKRIRKRIEKMSLASFETYKFGIIISKCLQTMDIETAKKEYFKAKEFNIKISTATYFSLLSLVAGLGEQGSSSGPVRLQEPPCDFETAQQVYFDMKNADMKLGESCYTALVRTYCMHDHAEEGLSIYREMQSLDIPPKNRTLSPLLAAFTDLRDASVSFSLFNEMMTRYGLQPTEKDYLNMLRLTTVTKDPRFYEILQLFAEDVLVPSHASWETLAQCFSDRDLGYKSTVVKPDVDGHICVTMTESGDWGCETLKNQKIVNDVDDVSSIDKKQERGKLITTRMNFQLKSIELEEFQRIELLSQIETIALERDPVQWKIFKEWLGKFTEGMIDIIIDGANVGFYKQNFLGAPTHIEYRQVDWMLRSLIARGCRPKLVLHTRHLLPKAVPEDCSNLVSQWQKEDLLYATPAGANDDWFWIYSTVHLKCFVVTNDEMRDHHFQMLCPKYFPRWKERHQVKFSFGSWKSKTVNHHSLKRKKLNEETHLTIQENHNNKSNNTNGYENNSIQLSDSNNNFHGGKNREYTSDPLNNSSSSSNGISSQSNYRKVILQLPSKYSQRIQYSKDHKSYFFPSDGSDKDEGTWLCAFVPEL